MRPKESLFSEVLIQTMYLPPCPNSRIINQHWPRSVDNSISNWGIFKVNATQVARHLMSYVWQHCQKCIFVSPRPVVSNRRSADQHRAVGCLIPVINNLHYFCFISFGIWMMFYWEKIPDSLFHPSSIGVFSTLITIYQLNCNCFIAFIPKNIVWQ